MGDTSIEESEAEDVRVEVEEAESRAGATGVVLSAVTDEYCDKSAAGVSNAKEPKLPEEPEYVLHADDDVVLTSRPAELLGLLLLLFVLLAVVGRLLTALLGRLVDVEITDREGDTASMYGEPTMGLRSGIEAKRCLVRGQSSPSSACSERLRTVLRRGVSSCRLCIAFSGNLRAGRGW